MKKVYNWLIKTRFLAKNSLVTQQTILCTKYIKLDHRVREMVRVASDLMRLSLNADYEVGQCPMDIR